jgi:hypothetical protein
VTPYDPHMDGWTAATPLTPTMPSSLDSILLCADRSSEAQDALRKASILARYLDARIELFACDAEHGWAVEQASVSEAARAALDACLSASRIYIEALRSSIPAADLQITTRVACARGVAEGVVERVRAAGHALVVKNFDTGPVHSWQAPTSGDLRLAEACEVPLLLTRARSWSTPLRVWVALDLRRCDLRHGREVLDVARTLADGCHGGWVVAYTESDILGEADARRSVDQACEAFGLAPGDLHLLSGDPVDELPKALRAAGADVLVMAKSSSVLAHRSRRPLAERLLGQGDFDVLLVPERRVVAAGSARLVPLATDATNRER